VTELPAAVSDDSLKLRNFIIKHEFSVQHLNRMKLVNWLFGDDIDQFMERSGGPHRDTFKVYKSIQDGAEQVNVWCEVEDFVVSEVHTKDSSNAVRIRTTYDCFELVHRYGRHEWFCRTAMKRFMVCKWDLELEDIHGIQSAAAFFVPVFVHAQKTRREAVSLRKERKFRYFIPGTPCVNSANDAFLVVRPKREVLHE